MQLFVGTWPPQKVQGQLAAYPRPTRRGLRWSTPAQWLVVIRPLGHVADSVIPPLIDTLCGALAHAPRIKVSIDPPRYGEWIQAPVKGLDELVDVVFEATEPLVPSTHPHKAWAAHLVLARGRTTRFEPAPLTASWTVKSLTLAKATRTSEGPGYEDVATFALGDSP